jgi:uncharacterized tellurite resistance protein B-like protein
VQALQPEGSVFSVCSGIRQGRILQFFRWIADLFRILLKYVGFVLFCMLAIGFFLPKEGDPSASMAIVLLTSFTWIVMPIALTIWSEKERAKKLSRSPAPVDGTQKKTSEPPKHNAVSNPWRTQPLYPDVETKEKTPEDVKLAPLSNPWRAESSDMVPETQERRPEPIKQAPAGKARHPQPSYQAGWVPKGENIIIAGREIDGMVYVGKAPILDNAGYGQTCRAFIDPKLAVSAYERDPAGTFMSYWPGYSSIQPACRATYLDWLAGGRTDSTVNPGYLFLFFYGLERRFFIDQPSELEKREILAEVERLRKLFGTNNSAHRYLTELINVASLSLNGAGELDDDGFIKSLLDSRSWELPLPLKVALGAEIAKGEPLQANALLLWFLCHPERRVRTPAERCKDEFMTLCKLKFDQRFPKGLAIAKPRKKLTHYYNAASNEFRGNVDIEVDGQTIPDISGLRKPIEIAQEIANEAMDELDKFSRYLGRTPNNGRGSIEAHALLPAVLWDIFPSTKLTTLGTWAAEHVSNGGLVPVAEVIQQFLGDSPDPNWKRQLGDAANILARLGYGLAPDLRHSLRSPAKTEPVIIFELGQKVEHLQKASAFYLLVLVDITLSAFIMHADKKVVEAERRALYDKVSEAVGITDIEQRTLNAHIDWYLSVPPDLSLMGSKLKDADADQQAIFRNIVVASAHADGIIQSEEVARIERVYKALGLDQALAYSDLHAGKRQDGLSVLRKAEAEAPGEKIPAVLKTAVAQLNSKRIAEIQADTARVSKVLGKIFSNGDEIIDAKPLTPASLLEGLDKKHADFVAIVIQQTHWPETDFDQLAKKAGLMPFGALEAINEWSFQNYGEGLLDAYNGYHVEPEIAATLRSRLAMES